MKNRLLLVEDEIDARESLVRSLARAGFACASASSAEGALSEVERLGQIDACIVDVVLGRDDHAGINLIPQLRERTRQAPIIVITAFADVEKVKLALNYGAAFLLEKPFAAVELVDVLRRVLAEHDSVAHLVDRALDAAKLTEKETAVARLLLKGLPSAEVAALEGNSDKTIRQHVSRIYAKCGVSSRAELFNYVFPS